ncbi:MAG: tRNA(Met) cytidine acetyltransferase TmcA [Ignisphaera sp.]
MLSENLKHLAKRVSSYITENFKEFKLRFSKELNKALNGRYRLMIMLAGDNAERQGVLCVDMLLSYLKWVRNMKKNIKILYVYHDEFDDALYRRMIVERFVRRYVKKHRFDVGLEIAVYENSEKYLGTTFHVLVIDLVNSLKPNDVGRLVNVVEGGGIIIVFTPRWSEWINRRNLFQMSLAVPQYPEPRNVFTRWFQTITMVSKGIYVYDVDGDTVVKFDEEDIPSETIEPISIPNNTIFPRELYKLALTQDQVNAINIIENLIDNPKHPYTRASVVLIADRGRGKSCAIGIALVGLIHNMLKHRNRIRIAVTAPAVTNVQSLMMLAMKALDTLGLKYDVMKKEDNVIELKSERFSIEYWSPAAIVKQDVDIVAVDEAAGIPVPLLHKIWLRFKRTIFATTIHGYEGAGRGFSIRFLKKIKEDRKTKLVIYEMEEPIRYSRYDPVERWVFRVLLLDAEPDDLTEEDLKHIEKKEFIYLKFDVSDLFTPEKENILRSLFGIYVLAHYRNEPDDLGMIADAPHHSVRGLALPNGKIVAAAQLAEEGPIPNDYIDSLLRGGKIPGNIIPDRLLKHGRLRDIGSGRGWRIVRIAVHPEVQGRGIGSYFLTMLIKEALERNYDWIGSGFGATEELLRFWIKNGFIPVHISPDRNPVSAEYTVLVIKPLTDTWNKIVELLNKEFKMKLIDSLYDTYRDLEIEVAHILLDTDYCCKKDGEECIKTNDFTAIQIDRLLSYVNGYMTYESCNDVIVRLVKHYWLSPKSCRELDKFEEMVTIAKVLQGLPWEIVADILHNKKSKIIETVRETVAKLTEMFIGLNREKAEKFLGGVTLDMYKV